MARIPGLLIRLTNATGAEMDCEFTFKVQAEKIGRFKNRFLVTANRNFRLKIKSKKFP